MKIRKAPLPSNRKSHTVYLVRRHGRKALESALEADETVTQYAWVVSAAQREAVQAIEWGEIESYYVDEDEIASKREEWDSNAEDWQAAINEALDAASVADARKALDTASSIEGEWGDDPSTGMVRRILGVLK